MRFTVFNQLLKLQGGKMKILKLLIFSSVISGCTTFNYTSSHSYWEHPKKGDSFEDYQACKNDNIDNELKTNQCMNEKGWNYVTKSGLPHT